MRRTLPLILAACAMLGTASPLLAAPCKDAKGKFIKCPPAAPAKAVRCKDGRGKFVKCGTPGAKPM